MIFDILELDWADFQELSIKNVCSLFKIRQLSYATPQQFILVANTVTLSLVLNLDSANDYSFTHDCLKAFAQQSPVIFILYFYLIFLTTQ